mmetsp:Transcript_5375/g.14421  ORF Transcript_5375/g.14421 Transcript_5375/m.14421 type:complete len:204 (+) Transcript_5375:2375-2986(+)
MAPPKLSRNAPVPDVVHPVKPGFFKHIRNDFQLSIADSPGTGCTHFFATHIPLRHEHGFDHITAPRAHSEPHSVVFFTAKLTYLFQLSFNFSPRYVTRHSCKHSSIFVHTSGCVHHIDFGQTMPSSACKIIRVVRWSDLDCSGTKFHIDELAIRNDWYLAIHERMRKMLADQTLIARIIGMHRDCNISKHSFETRRGDHELYC